VLPDAHTRIALLHRNGTLMARHPPLESALGRQVPQMAEVLASALAGSVPARAVSPLDGVERFGAVRMVPDYPLVVVVSRDVASALAPWRAQALRSGLNTLALGTLAALLLGVVMRQLARLNAARESLEVSQERYALAAAGSDDGIWDWDLQAGTAYESRRARADRARELARRRFDAAPNREEPAVVGGASRGAFDGQARVALRAQALEDGHVGHVHRRLLRRRDERHGADAAVAVDEDQPVDLHQADRLLPQVHVQVVAAERRKHAGLVLLDQVAQDDVGRLHAARGLLGDHAGLRLELAGGAVDRGLVAAHAVDDGQGDDGGDEAAAQPCNAAPGPLCGADRGHPLAIHQRRHATVTLGAASAAAAESSHTDCSRR